MPRLAAHAEVVQPALLQQRRDGRAQGEFTGLPGVHRQRGRARWQGGRVAEQACGELLGGERLGGVGGEELPVDGVPVQAEGAVGLRGVGGALRGREAVAALGCGMLRVAEQQGLFGAEERQVPRVGCGTAVRQDVGRADDRVGVLGDQGGEVAVLAALGVRVA